MYVETDTLEKPSGFRILRGGARDLRRILTRCSKPSGITILRGGAGDMRGHSLAVANRQASQSIAAAHVICGDTHALYQTVRVPIHRGGARDLSGHSPAVPNR